MSWLKWTVMIRLQFNLSCQRLLLLLLTVFFSACGHAPHRQPIAIEKANKSELEARRAVRDGDLMRAKELFNLAMLKQLSLDNIQAVTQIAINLSAVYHKLGEDIVGLALLDRILTEYSDLITPEQRATIAFRKAIIYTDSGSIPDAETSLQNASHECIGQCSVKTGIENLYARIYLSKGDYKAALQRSKAVINSGAEIDELANSYRVAALSELEMGLNDDALSHFLAVLDLDKQLALSSRIKEDLKGAARVLVKLNRNQEAESYTNRANALADAVQKLRVNATNKIQP